MIVGQGFVCKWKQERRRRKRERRDKGVVRHQKRKTNLTIAGRGFVRGWPEPLSPAVEQTVAVVVATAAAHRLGTLEEHSQK